MWKKYVFYLTHVILLWNFKVRLREYLFNFLSRMIQHHFFLTQIRQYHCIFFLFCCLNVQVSFNFCLSKDSLSFEFCHLKDTVSFYFCSPNDAVSFHFCPPIDTVSFEIKVRKMQYLYFFVLRIVCSSFCINKKNKRYSIFSREKKRRLPYLYSYDFTHNDRKRNLMLILKILVF